MLSKLDSPLTEFVSMETGDEESSAGQRAGEGTLCCVPTSLVQCQDKEIPDPKMGCTNLHCTSTRLLHQKCFDNLERQLRRSQKQGSGLRRRSRPMSGSQEDKMFFTECALVIAEEPFSGRNLASLCRSLWQRKSQSQPCLIHHHHHHHQQVTTAWPRSPIQQWKPTS